MFWYHLGRVYFRFKLLGFRRIISNLRVRFQRVKLYLRLKVVMKKSFLSVVTIVIIIIIIYFSHLLLVYEGVLVLAPKSVKISHAQGNIFLYPKGLFYLMSHFKFSVSDFGVCIYFFSTA